MSDETSSSPVGPEGSDELGNEVSPVDVVTVTANPAVDQTLWIPGFRPGQVNRVAREELSPGGKGVNVAAFLKSFGVPVLATGFLGTQNARLFEDFFLATGIGHRFVPVAGTTRTGVKIVDETAGETTDINFPGFRVGPEEVASLEATVGDLSAPGRWVVLAGSLPQGAPLDLYGTLAERAHQTGALVALDTSGPALGAAMAGRPDMIKPNRAELEELTGQPLVDRSALVDAAQGLVSHGVQTAVVSLGADGALFVRQGEAPLFAAAPPVTVASTVGAGDAMVAGTLAATLRALPLPEVAAIAVAFSAVAISRIGPYLEANAVEEIAKTVTVQELR